MITDLFCLHKRFLLCKIRVTCYTMEYSKERTTMKFSTKSRYALRLMAELARYAPGTTVSL